MAPKLFFVGTAGFLDVVGSRNQGGFLIVTDRAVLHVDPGAGAAVALGAQKLRPSGVFIVHPDRAHDASLINAPIVDSVHGGIEILRKSNGAIFRLPECKIAYLTARISKKDAADFLADVLVLAVHKDAGRIISRLKPKLVVITCFDESVISKNPVYVARGLQKSTGIQTIAAQEGLTVDLFAYSALAEQRSLSGFTG